MRCQSRTKWNREATSDNIYYVDISGTYLPNPEVPQYTLTGEITYAVDIENKTCKISSDPYDIESTLLVYVVNYFG